MEERGGEGRGGTKERGLGKSEAGSDRVGRWKREGKVKEEEGVKEGVTERGKEGGELGEGRRRGFHIGFFEKGKSSDAPHLPGNSVYYQCFDS